LRRLWSTFASGVPGAGLLVMRLVAGTALVFRGLEGLAGILPLGPDLLSVFQVGLGFLLLAGLWTRLAGRLVTWLQLWRLIFRPVDPSIHVLLATLGLALALLGPCAWSVDVRLFGRRRIHVRDRSRPPMTR
jgi:putative oxidoreductase